MDIKSLDPGDGDLEHKRLKEASHTPGRTRRDIKQRRSRAQTSQTVTDVRQAKASTSSCSETIKPKLDIPLPSPIPSPLEQQKQQPPKQHRASFSPTSDSSKSQKLELGIAPSSPTSGLTKPQALKRKLVYTSPTSTLVQLHIPNSGSAQSVPSPSSLERPFTLSHPSFTPLLKLTLSANQHKQDMSGGRPPRQRGGRAGVNDQGEELAIWSGCQSDIERFNRSEKKAADLKSRILAAETRLKEKQLAGKNITIQEIDDLDLMYREQLKIADAQKTLIGADGNGGLLQNVNLLKALVAANEESREEVTMSRGSTSRDSHSRSAVDPYDGPSDSPGPSPAENRQVRKLGGTVRTSSQPPRNLDVLIRSDGPSEPAERNASKPKIVYAVGEEVAFKRKSGEELDWIQGIVTRVIGEGKSRRYEVRDPYPDDPNSVDNIYKSSASQMVPIPPLNAKLEDYDKGKRVLALYPSTSTFYRADVKGMEPGGKEVLVLFEEEVEGEMEKKVDRRLVLDHKG